ncbi:MAG: bifunctional diaminohydroxyphosphoribosylaminopyrimidine deaminase/5-amino-6-(5-phosphoribosylamino)uracil reductase RibD [Candidatus Eiseniibacteriota bacterium]
MNARSLDLAWMQEALALAERGLGRTRPNPAVGAVIVRNGRIVGRGFHRRAGAPHAECEAIRDAGAKARGATLYVSLEPCAHHGRTPPCVPKILGAGIRRVVAAVRDPDPRVHGRGFRWLKREGIAVTSGVLEAEARALNAGYFRAHEDGRPRIALKLATSLDGKLAPAVGGSRWLTGPPARRAAHALRSRHDTVLIGANTLRRDDPELTVRHVRVSASRQPLRVVVSSDLDLPRSARLFRAPLASGTVIATVAPEHVARAKRRAFERRAAALAKQGVTIWFLPRGAGGIDLPTLLARLAHEGRQDVLVEGGARLAARLADLGVVDDVWLFLSPTLLGGRALPWAFGERATSLPRAWRLASAVTVPVGEDWVVHGRPARNGG